MAKKFPPESQDVTEPLPGMPNPIEQAKLDKKKEQPIKPKGMKGGGYVRAADGCAQRGKTRGKMV